MLESLENRLPLAASVSISDGTLVEGQFSEATMDFTVSLSEPLVTPFIVNYATRPLTATPDADYRESAGSVYFEAGTTTQTISIPIVGDPFDEPNEQFEVVLSPPGVGSMVSFSDINENGDSTPFGFTEFNGAIYFSADDGVHGTELWKWDGTNYSLVADINFGSGSSTPSYLTVWNNALYFSAFTPDASGEIWRYDGTSATRVTNFIKPQFIESQPRELVVYKNDLYFVQNHNFNGHDDVVRLRADGSTTVLDLNSQSGGNPGWLMVYKDQLVFRATNETNGYEMWTYNGTSLQMREIVPGSTGSNAALFTEVNGILYFTATGYANGQWVGRELFKYDGTTVDVALDLRSGFDSSSPEQLVAYNGSVYFAARGRTDASGVGIREFWKFDGTTASLVIENAAPVHAGLGAFAVFNNELYFSMADGNGGTDIWRHNGTISGPVYDANTGSELWNYGLTAIGNYLFFRAEDPVVGTEVHIVRGDAYIADGVGVGTILDNDPVEITADDALFIEGDSGTTEQLITVRLSTPPESTVTVEYQVHPTFGDDAADNSDFGHVFGTVIFASGQQTATVAVPIFGDTVYEGNETFYFRLFGATGDGAWVRRDPTLITIREEDLQIRAIDTSMIEFGGQPREAWVHVEFSDVTLAPFTLNYVVSNGTALDGQDYVASSGTTTVPAGVRSHAIPVPIVDNDLYELSETVVVSFSNASTGTLVDNQAVLTIIDDDPIPVLSMDDISIAEGTGGIKQAVFTINLTGQTAVPVTLVYSTLAVEAMPGTDFANTGGNLTFDPGDTQLVVTVGIYGDTEFEADERFKMTLSRVTNATPTYLEAVATILNDDSNPNQPPTAENRQFTVAKDQLVSDRGIATDPEGQTLSYSLVTAPTTGIVDLKTDGTFTYTPRTDFNGTVTFTYRASDGQAFSNVATVSITYTPVNDRPRPQGDQAFPLEDTSISRRVTAFDPDGDVLTFAVLQGPANGTLVMQPDGRYTYTPNPNFFGIDPFTFTVSDGEYTVESSSFIQVFAVNDAPAAVSETYNISEDGTIEDFLRAVDVDSEDFTFQIVNNGTNGGVVDFDHNNGRFRYRPNPNFFGTDTFTFRANDGSLNSNVGTITINMSPVNDAPTALLVIVPTEENVAVNVQLLGSDVDSASLTYTPGTPTGGTISNFDPAAGTFTYTPNPGFAGMDNFSYTVSDGSLMATANVRIEVKYINKPPVMNDQSFETNEDISLSARVIATDDVGGVTFSILTPPAHGTITAFDPLTADFTYVPNANYFGPDSFVVRASDPDHDVDATISLNVVSINDPPVASLWQFGTPEDTPLSERLRASDADGDPLTYRVVAQPTRGTVSVDPATGNFIYTPIADRTGTDTFTFVVNDGTVDSNDATVFVTIHPVDDPPVAISLSLSTNEDVALQEEVVAADKDTSHANLTYEIVNPPSHGQLTFFSATTGEFTYVPDTNYNGPDFFTFRARNNGLDSNLGTISLTVRPVNDPPIVFNDTAQVTEDNSVTRQLTASDPDGDSLLFAVLSGPSYGTLTLSASGQYTYTPQANYFGADAFTFTVTDGSATVERSVSITVSPVNDAPVAVADNVSGTEDVNLVINVRANDSDADGDSLTVQIVSPPTRGTATVNANGTITYDSPTDYFGPVSFTYRVTDGVLTSNTATVSINLAAGLETPVISITPDDPSANLVNLSNAEVTVAILGSDAFSVSQVIVSSLTFGRLGTENSLVVHKRNGPKHEFRDVNGDGYLDLVAYFKPSSTGLTTSSTTATLRGRLQDGQTFSDSDSVTVTSKGGKPNRNTTSNSRTLAATDAYFAGLD